MTREKPWIPIILLMGFVVASCSSSVGTKEKTPPERAASSKEALYETGHTFFQEGDLDSAVFYLESSLDRDSSYRPSLVELGQSTTSER